MEPENFAKTAEKEDELVSKETISPEQADADISEDQVDKEAKLILTELKYDANATEFTTAVDNPVEPNSWVSDEKVKLPGELESSFDNGDTNNVIKEDSTELTTDIDTEIKIPINNEERPVVEELTTTAVEEENETRIQELPESKQSETECSKLSLDEMETDIMTTMEIPKEDIKQGNSDFATDTETASNQPEENNETAVETSNLILREVLPEENTENITKLTAESCSDQLVEQRQELQNSERNEQVNLKLQNEKGLSSETIADDLEVAVSADESTGLLSSEIQGTLLQNIDLGFMNEYDSNSQYSQQSQEQESPQDCTNDTAEFKEYQSKDDQVDLGINNNQSAALIFESEKTKQADTEVELEPYTQTQESYLLISDRIAASLHPEDNSQVISENHGEKNVTNEIEETETLGSSHELIVIDKSEATAETVANSFPEQRDSTMMLDEVAAEVDEMNFEIISKTSLDVPEVSQSVDESTSMNLHDVVLDEVPISSKDELLPDTDKKEELLTSFDEEGIIRATDEPGDSSNVQQDHEVLQGSLNDIIKDNKELSQGPEKYCENKEAEEPKTEVEVPKAKPEIVDITEEQLLCQEHELQNTESDDKHQLSEIGSEESNILAEEYVSPAQNVFEKESDESQVTEEHELNSNVTASHAVNESTEASVNLSIPSLISEDSQGAETKPANDEVDYYIQNEPSEFITDHKLSTVVEETTEAVEAAQKDFTYNTPAEDESSSLKAIDNDAPEVETDMKNTEPQSSEAAEDNPNEYEDNAADYSALNSSQAEVTEPNVEGVKPDESAQDGLNKADLSKTTEQTFSSPSNPSAVDLSVQEHEIQPEEIPPTDFSKDSIINKEQYNEDLPAIDNHSSSLSDAKNMSEPDDKSDEEKVENEPEQELPEESSPSNPSALALSAQEHEVQPEEIPPKDFSDDSITNKELYNEDLPAVDNNSLSDTKNMSEPDDKADEDIVENEHEQELPKVPEELVSEISPSDFPEESEITYLESRPVPDVPESLLMEIEAQIIPSESYLLSAPYERCSVAVKVPVLHGIDGAELVEEPEIVGDNQEFREYQRDREIEEREFTLETIENPEMQDSSGSERKQSVKSEAEEPVISQFVIREDYPDEGLDVEDDTPLTEEDILQARKEIDEIKKLLAHVTYTGSDINTEDSSSEGTQSTPEETEKSLEFDHQMTATSVDPSTLASHSVNKEDLELQIAHAMAEEDSAPVTSKGSSPDIEEYEVVANEGQKSEHPTSEPEAVKQEISSTILSRHAGTEVADQPSPLTPTTEASFERIQTTEQMQNEFN